MEHGRGQHTCELHTDGCGGSTEASAAARFLDKYRHRGSYRFTARGRSLQDSTSARRSAVRAVVRYLSVRRCSASGWHILYGRGGVAARGGLARHDKWSPDQLRACSWPAMVCTCGSRTRGLMGHGRACGGQSLFARVSGVAVWAMDAGVQRGRTSCARLRRENKRERQGTV